MTLIFGFKFMIWLFAISAFCFGIVFAFERPSHKPPKPPIGRSRRR